MGFYCGIFFRYCVFRNCLGTATALHWFKRMKEMKKRKEENLIKSVVVCSAVFFVPLFFLRLDREPPP